MKIFRADQIRNWDQYTIHHEPIASIDLMERAAKECIQWLIDNCSTANSFKVICGKGNNGGDGLAIARLLHEEGLFVEVYILDSGKSATDDFEINLQRLQAISVYIMHIQSPQHLPSFEKKDIIIDALYGSGLNKPLNGLSMELVQHINNTKNKVISIDIPSGLYTDESSKGLPAVKADRTLSFQTYKTGLLVAENAPHIGQVHILDIGLHAKFEDKEESDSQLISAALISQIFVPRQPFAHKGTYGHALMIGGSYGKIGAVLLATKACLKSGAGLTTSYSPQCGYDILQTAAPEAMVIADKDENQITGLPADINKYSAVGIGPGTGTAEGAQKVLADLIRQYDKPVVIDADGVNCLALDNEILTHLPPYSILTPHPKEFERLFGESENDFQRMRLARKKAEELAVIIILKGHHTFIATPKGQGYFNSTGNPGMAKGGSGDVLTGIITSFLAQGYPPIDASVLGVYIHGLAGDIAAETLSKESMLATDIINFLGQAFKKLNIEKVSWNEHN